MPKAFLIFFAQTFVTRYIFGSLAFTKSQKAQKQREFLPLRYRTKIRNIYANVF